MSTTGGTVNPTSEPSKIQAVSGSAAGSKATPKDGYRFIGWYKSDNLNNKLSENENFAPAKGVAYTDSTYVAMFEALPDVNIYYDVKTNGSSGNKAGGTVSPTSQSGSPTSTSSFTGANVTKTNSGYKFVGWTRDDSTITYTTETHVTPQQENGVYVSATYYANFVEADNVTYEYIPILNGTTTNVAGYVSPASESVKPFAGSVGGSTAYAYAGYEFVCWSTNTSESGSFTTNTSFQPTQTGNA